MTGYGRGNSNSPHGRVSIEIKVVNARFLDLKIRGVELAPELEAKVRDKIRQRLQRGTVNVYVALEDSAGLASTAVFNKERFEALDRIIAGIQREYGRHIDLNEIITSNDLFIEDGSSNIESKPVLKALESALQQVEKMRRMEGKSLAGDMHERIASLQSSLEQIEIESKNSADDRKVALTERLQVLAGDLKLDENRIYQEIVILADRYDLSEELVRCGSHLAQFNNLMDVDEPVGKRLNFLLQEIGREINTVGSKSNLTTVINLIVNMKDQVEQLREQVQNIL